MRLCRWPKNMSLHADDEAAVLERGEIGEGPGLKRRIPRRFSVDSQAGHPTVGIDIEPEMGHPPAERDSKWILGIASEP